MAKTPDPQPGSGRIDVIRAVQTPLGFFVLVVLVVEAILGLVAATSESQDRMLALAGMLVVILALIAVVAVMAYHRPEALAGVRPPSAPVQASVFYPPTDRERYNRLFDGFSDCEFYAFNPPFQVENIGRTIFEASLDTHEKRYASKVSSHYLFFDRESYGNGQRFFDALARRIGREQVEANVECVCVPNAAERPGYTFFIGRKRGASAIIFYPNAVVEQGIPKAAIYLEGADDLYFILQDFFLRQWADARRKSAAPTASDSSAPAV